MATVRLIPAVLLAAALACSTGSPPGPGGQAAEAAAPGEEWVRGTEKEKFQLVGRHLRGFDMAMVGTGHRYTELYWAGRDRNWQYAAYQLDKIRLAIELAMERRPRRAASAQNFLATAIPPMQAAIEKEDGEIFDEQFRSLTAACNHCHALEEVAFMQPQPPQSRLSPVRLAEQ